MAYIVNQDIIDRVGNDAALALTTDSGATIAQSVLDEVRETAEGEVNGYLGRRYAVPVDLTAHADLTGTLRGVTLKLAVYHLLARRPPVAAASRSERDDAIGWLEKVRDGVIPLPASVTPAATTSDDPKATWGSSSASASREDMV